MVSKTDVATLIRYLDDAAAFYRRHATSAKESDKSRLLGKMSNKLKRKSNNYGSCNKEAGTALCHI